MPDDATAALGGPTGALLLALAFAALLAFAIAMARLFTRPAGVPPMMRVLALAGLVGAVVDLWALARTRPPEPALALLGAACCVAGLLVFRGAERATRARRLSVAFSPDAPEHLVTGGPYAHVRHPFYTAYALVWLGGALGAAHAAPWTVLVVMVSLYAAAARAEEAKFAASPLREAYAAYRARAGLFWPRPRAAATAPAPAPRLSPHSDDA